MIALVAAAVGPLATGWLVSRAWRAPAIARARRARPRVTGPPRGRVARGLEAALRDAALSIGVEEALQIWAGGVLAVGAVAMPIDPLLAPPALLGALAAGPTVLWALRHRSRARLAAALPEGLDRCAAVLRAGGTVGDAVRVLAATEGPLAPGFQRVCARADLGVTLTAALARWPGEVRVPEARGVAGALAVAAAMGGRSAAALESLARSMREQLGARADARALSAQARMSALVVGLAPIGYLLFSAVADPATAHVLVGTPTGRVCLVGGLVLEALAAVWMRRLLRMDAGGRG